MTPSGGAKVASLSPDDVHGQVPHPANSLSTTAGPSAAAAGFKCPPASAVSGIVGHALQGASASGRCSYGADVGASDKVGVLIYHPPLVTENRMRHWSLEEFRRYYQKAAQPYEDVSSSLGDGAFALPDPPEAACGIYAKSSDGILSTVVLALPSGQTARTACKLTIEIAKLLQQ